MKSNKIYWMKEVKNVRTNMHRNPNHLGSNSSSEWLELIVTAAIIIASICCFMISIAM